MYLAQGGRQLLTWFAPGAPGEDAALTAAAQALVIALRRGRRMFTLELIDDAPIQRDTVTEALRAAGFSSAPRGLDWQS
jgi:ATP-dependent Lhr-like helicase